MLRLLGAVLMLLITIAVPTQSIRIIPCNVTDGQRSGNTVVIPLQNFSSGGVSWASGARNSTTVQFLNCNPANISIVFDYGSGVGSWKGVGLSLTIAGCTFTNCSVTIVSSGVAPMLAQGGSSLAVFNTVANSPQGCFLCVIPSLASNVTEFALILSQVFMLDAGRALIASIVSNQLVNVCIIISDCYISSLTSTAAEMSVGVNIRSRPHCGVGSFVINGTAAVPVVRNVSTMCFRTTVVGVTPTNSSCIYMVASALYCRKGASVYVWLTDSNITITSGGSGVVGTLWADSVSDMSNMTLQVQMSKSSCVIAVLNSTVSACASFVSVMISLPTLKNLTVLVDIGASNLSVSIAQQVTGIAIASTAGVALCGSNSNLVVIFDRLEFRARLDDSVQCRVVVASGVGTTAVAVVALTMQAFCYPEAAAPQVMVQNSVLSLMATSGVDVSVVIPVYAALAVFGIAGTVDEYLYLDSRLSLIHSTLAVSLPFGLVNVTVDSGICALFGVALAAKGSSNAYMIVQDSKLVIQLGYASENRSTLLLGQNLSVQVAVKGTPSVVLAIGGLATLATSWYGATAYTNISNTNTTVIGDNVNVAVSSSKSLSYGVIAVAGITVYAITGSSLNEISISVSAATLVTSIANSSISVIVTTTKSSVAIAGLAMPFGNATNCTISTDVSQSSMSIDATSNAAAIAALASRNISNISSITGVQLAVRTNQTVISCAKTCVSVGVLPKMSWNNVASATYVILNTNFSLKVASPPSEIFGVQPTPSVSGRVGSILSVVEFSNASCGWGGPTAQNNSRNILSGQQPVLAIGEALSVRDGTRLTDVSAGQWFPNMTYNASNVSTSTNTSSVYADSTQLFTSATIITQEMALITLGATALRSLLVSNFVPRTPTQSESSSMTSTVSKSLTVSQPPSSTMSLKVTDTPDSSSLSASRTFSDSVSSSASENRTESVSSTFSDSVTFSASANHTQSFSSTLSISPSMSKSKGNTSITTSVDLDSYSSSSSRSATTSSSLTDSSTFSCQLFPNGQLLHTVTAGAPVTMQGLVIDRVTTGNSTKYSIHVGQVAFLDARQSGTLNMSFAFLLPFISLNVQSFTSNTIFDDVKSAARVVAVQVPNYFHANVTLTFVATNFQLASTVIVVFSRHIFQCNVQYDVEILVDVIPHPLPLSPSTVGGAMAGAMSLSALVSGGPSVGMLSTSAAVYATMDCQAEDEPPSWNEGSPPISLPDGSDNEAASWKRGALVWFLSLVMGMSLVAALCGWLWVYSRRGKKMTMVETAECVGMPSVLCFVIQSQVRPMVTAVISFLEVNSDHVGDIALCVVIVLLLATWFTYLGVVAGRPSGHVELKRETPVEEIIMSSSSSSSLCAVIARGWRRGCEKRFKWEVRGGGLDDTVVKKEDMAVDVGVEALSLAAEPKDNQPRALPANHNNGAPVTLSRRWLQRHRFIFQECAFRWMICFETTMLVVLGVSGSVLDDQHLSNAGCLSQAIVVCVVEVCTVILLVALRPQETLVSEVQSLILGGVSVLASMCIVVGRIVVRIDVYVFTAAQLMECAAMLLVSAVQIFSTLISIKHLWDKRQRQSAQETEQSVDEVDILEGVIPLKDIAEDEEMLLDVILDHVEASSSHVEQSTLRTVEPNIDIEMDPSSHAEDMDEPSGDEADKNWWRDHLKRGRKVRGGLVQSEIDNRHRHSDFLLELIADDDVHNSDDEHTEVDNVASVKTPDN